MKKAIFAGLAAALVAGLLIVSSGCGGQAAAGSSDMSVEKYNQINVGMSKDQVKSIAGEPARTETKNAGGSMAGMQMSNGNMDYWYYQGSKGWVRLEVADGKVTSKSGY